MWWFRLTVLVAAAWLAAGCGFRPLYGGGNRGAEASELAAIKIEPIEDRAGQILHNHLLDRLNPRGRPRQSKYVLVVRLDESIRRLAVQKNEITTRANLRLAAGFQLFKDGAKTPDFGGQSVTVSSFNILGAEDLATLISEKDARARAARQIADDITSRIATYIARKHAGRGRTKR